MRRSILGKEVATISFTTLEMLEEANQAVVPILEIFELLKQYAPKNSMKKNLDFRIVLLIDGCLYIKRINEDSIVVFQNDLLVEFNKDKQYLFLLEGGLEQSLLQLMLHIKRSFHVVEFHSISLQAWNVTMILQVELGIQGNNVKEEKTNTSDL
ncbi:Uncharacterised protein [Listeria grayi]|uniref:Uncharacterized protein n=1 Tax=Listeria grayi FSL F6-1183 TaxID=1265827 RepID=A0A829R9D8_LISGR|nr:hypothetical protein [Listeria grayi]EUJ30432.1 hypothetical protein LMUR_01115 [Listeria grayi FSL F6-1183]VEI31257.1 Uncharacterised protein [Listeria grayi]